LIGSTREALGFSVGLLVAFLVLYGVSKLIVWGVRRFFPTGWSFVFRQGLANLYRPNNQTQTLIISIGLGAAILTTLFIIQGLLLENVGSMDAGNQPNMILFGIEKEQKDDIRTLTEEYDMPVIQQVPIVTMRLAGWQGRTKADWLADTSRTASRWAINREARVTFRDSLNADEELIEGVFTSEIQPGDSIFVSLADNYARSMDVSIGDEMVWNVQGALITSYVGSIRKIDFRSMQTRFFILFPNGVLERAPQFQVLVTKSPDTETTAQYRSAVVRAFPNVSVIDLGMILVTLNDILTKVSYIIQFMAGFSILTGLIVLISSLFLSKYQRIRESVLLRTIGALRHQIFRINFVEYLLIGSLSALTGIVLALIGSYFLATQQLELEYDIRWGPILIVFLIIVSLTVLIGLLNSREVLNKSPLEVLRKEV
jgi:putative ABC transport system permease protein